MLGIFELSRKAIMTRQRRQVGGDFDAGRFRFEPQIELGAALGQRAQQTVDREFRFAGPNGNGVENQFVGSP